MGVMLQAAYRLAPNVSVPAPVGPGNATVPWWYDHVAAQAKALRLAGFSAVLLPPVLKTNDGDASGADGYGVYDDYDLGAKDDGGAVNTRFGSRAQLQRCVATLRANGLDVYVDTVPHQRSGGTNGTYAYLGSDGKTRNGRFPKHPSCFVGRPPRVPRDPIAGPPADDFAFGDELAPINAVPHGYVMQGLIDAGDWLTRSLGIQGYRVDDVKGMAVEFVHTWLTAKSMTTNFAVAEYYDGNPQSLNWWVWESGMNGRCNVFDFTLHFALQGMCNNGSNWDMAQLDHAGLAGVSPMQAVTFVENPDTDTDGFATVVRNKILAYAYILTSEGYPCVYYRDYSQDDGCYGLKPQIDTLVWIHENLAFGQTIQRWKDFQTFVFERLGYPNLLVGMNNDMSGGWRSVQVQTAFGPNVQLHDYTGHAGDVWTDGSGMATIGIPQNDDGAGYVCYSRVGYSQAFSISPQAVTQCFEGATDLDIPGAQDGQIVDVGKIWCAADTAITAALECSRTNFTAASWLELNVIGPDGAAVAQQRWTGSSGAAMTIAARTSRGGWHSASLAAGGVSATPVPFTLTLTYSAPGDLQA